MKYDNTGRKIMELLLDEGETVNMQDMDILDAHAVMHDRVMEHKVNDTECREMFIDNMLENFVFITIETKVTGGSCAMHQFLSIDA